MSLIILSISFFLFSLYLFLEKRRRSADIDSVPIRIHVNGTRGKSSVTRLIHSVLVEAGWNVYAKTTGSSPRLLFPDRSEIKIDRNRISISEQGKFLRYAAERKADAIVLECMAVQEEYQRKSETFLVRATHTVITNLRTDHSEWGDPTQWTELAFAETVPTGGTLVLGNSFENSILLKTAQVKRSTVFFPDSDDKGKSERFREILSRLSYREHSENLEIADEICKKLNIPESTIRDGMSKTRPDPGALKIVDSESNGEKIGFIFAFAANDVDSWEKIYRSAMNERRCERVVVVFNSRRERPFRTLEFSKLLSRLKEVETIHYFGPWMRAFLRVYRGTALVVDRNKKRETSGYYDPSVESPEKTKTVSNSIWIGAGNFRGSGRVWMETLCDRLREKSAWKS
ncbi:poly-gamma-glutamate synthase PgsB [Leptospira gomenensis]|uniref:Poly-gamma-glutamate synthase PgsB n=1 Tax=Leptospira gomenensis TaxID=2484974 RepID=A0A5F1YFN2_9LEPT|nr:poly-gamma-glutamate synthase PgsB [Leptospira gomenensis]TGK37523.1 poly-gamma-glutamate synthase PgsB [Leptospira gomenensis]TGK39471.1 poly-gamma-glutamate synthase PgsB [Leptospira gomenensis]TGK43107.1 poly-gamma-glutamate synthase PgsB [Leptospira gomenensis]TGK55064.1 poly-gamma-glutamate synthase PgsB [Leptospira gomenensis]